MAISRHPPLPYLRVSRVCSMRPGYTRCFDRTSVYFCASPLQNLAVDYYAEPRRTIISLSVSLWNDLVDPVFDGVGLAGFKSRSNAFLLA